jgi:hypothetical protein
MSVIYLVVTSEMPVHERDIPKFDRKSTNRKRKSMCKKRKNLTAQVKLTWVAAISNVVGRSLLVIGAEIDAAVYIFAAPAV